MNLKIDGTNANHWAQNLLLVLTVLFSCSIAPLAEAYSTGITGRTVRDGSLGCTTSCHSGTISGTVTITTSGPTSLAPGQRGNYTVTNNSDLNVASRAAGVNIASSDGVFTPAGNLTTNGSTEMYHFTPNLTNGSGDTVFSFSWTMPGAAAPGSGHTIYATGRVWYSGNWNHAANFGITTAAPLTALVNGSATPASIGVGGTGTLSTSGGAGGGAVSYVPSNSGICSVSGTIVTAVSVGTCTITANKAADSLTTALSDAVTFSIVQGTQTITFTPVAPKLTTAAPFSVFASGGGSGNPVTFVASGVCTNSGATITLTGAVGTCTVTANQAGNANYLAAPTTTLNIGVVASGEVFPPNCQIPLGWITSPGAMTGWDVATDQVATGSCSLKSNVLPDAGTNLSARIQFTGTFIAGNVTFSRRVSTEASYDCLRFLVDGVEQGVGGTCPNLGTYLPGALIGASGELPYATITVPITAGSHTLIWSYDKDTFCCDGGSLDAVWIDNVTLPLAPPAITSPSTATGFFGLNFFYSITASNSPWGFSATGVPPGLTVSTGGLVSGIPTTLGTYTMMVTATSGAGTVTAPVTVTISQQPQTISFPAINNRLTTAPLFGPPVSGNLNSGIPVVITSSTTGVCTAGGVNGTTIQIVGVGICTLTANQAGNANFSAAAPVAQSFQVSTQASELFPANCTFPAGWSVGAGGTVGWTLDINSSSSQGACSLRSIDIGDSQTARVQFTAAFAAGNVEFKVRTDSEGFYDCLFFYIDGVKQGIGNGSCALGGTGYSGVVPFTQVSVPITAGTHTLMWGYEKDGSVSTVADAAWIDELVFPQFTLTVNKTGSNGFGTVFSEPSGIVCGSTCSAALSGSVSLTAFANPGSYLASWSGGGCSGNGACIVSLAGNTTVTAVFSLIVAPGAPQTVASTPGNGQATITFAPPASNGGGAITIYTSTCVASGQATRIDNAAVSPITATGLTNGIQYSCTVTGTNSAGTGAASAATLVTPRTTPSAPQNFAVAPGNGSATLTFTTPTSDGGAAITGYIGVCFNGPTAIFGNSVASPIVITGLTNGITYQCRMAAQNAAGNGLIAGDLPVTPRTVPSAPTNLAAAPRDGRAIFNFDAPVSDGSAAITGYIVSCNGGTISALGAFAPITINGLTNGVALNCTVAAINAAGTGSTAAFASITPAVQPGVTYWGNICSSCHGMVPAVPQLNAAGTTGTVLNYAIANQPSMTGNPAIVGLTNAEKDAIAVYLASVIPPSAETTPFNTPKTIDLASQISIGTISFELLESMTPPQFGTLSSFTGTEITYTPNAGTVGADTFTFRGRRDAPSPLLGDERTVNITVQLPPPPVINSVLTASGTNGAAFTYQITATNSPTSYNAINLPAGLSVNPMSGAITGTALVGGSFMATIIANNQGGTGMATLLITLNPAGQTISFPAQSPTQPFSPGGTFPVSPPATASSGLPVAYASKTTGVCTVTGTTVMMLSADTCTIGANQAGDTNFAAAIEVTRDVTITPTLPGAPSIGVASPGNNQAVVSFTAPSNTGGINITGYTATCTATGQATRTGTGSVSPVIVSGLTNLVQYSCSVKATNSVGTGAASGNALVTPDQIPTPASIVSAASTSFTVNAPGSFSLVATGYPATFTYAVSGTLPNGATLNTMTGVLSGTPTQAGTFMVTFSATNTGGTGMQVFTLTVNPAGQTIGFTNPGAQPFSASTVPLTALATSGLAVSFVSDTQTICTVAGSSVTLVTTGTCTIRAQQGGNANFNPAADVAQSFSIGQGSQTITFGAQTSPRNYASGGTFAINPLASASSALAVTHTSLTTSVCTVAGNTVTMVRAGGCTIAANQAGNANFAAAAQVTQSVTINATAPGAPTLNTATGGDTKITLAFTAPVNDGGAGITTYTANCSAITATGTSSPITVTGLTNGVAYSCSVTATNSGGSSVASNSILATPNVLPGATVWNANCNTGGCHAGNPNFFRLNAGGTNANVLNYTAANPGLNVPGLMVTVINSLTPQQKLDLAAYIAEFIPAVTATTPSATPVNISVSSQVFLNSPTVALTSLQQAGAPANGTLSFPGGTTITYTPNVGFTGADSFSYRGFNAGVQTDVRTVTVTVNPAAPVITSALTATGTIGQAFNYQIAASNAPGSYNASNLPAWAAVSTVTGAITGTPNVVGTTMVTISATGVGGTGSATLAININLIPQTISFAAQTTASRAYVQGGTFIISPTATGGTSGNPVTYSATTSACAASGTTVTILSAGICTIAANQAGNATYAAAAQVTQSVAITGIAPAAPVIGTAQAGNTQATINFVAPINTGGLPIALYTVHCNGVTVSGPASPIIVSGLSNGVVYSCTVQATNLAGTSPVSGAVMVTPAAIMFTNIVYSRKLHGNGVGDKNLTVVAAPIDGAITVEPRQIGTGHRIVFVFDNPPTSVTTLTVRDANNNDVGSPTPSFIGNELIVTITGVADNKRVNVSATGVNGALDVSRAIGFLIGDVNSSHEVNASDISAVKSRSGVSLNIGNNFLFDLNASGTITNADVSLVKARSGLVLSP